MSASRRIRRAQCRFRRNCRNPKSVRLGVASARTALHHTTTSPAGRFGLSLPTHAAQGMFLAALQNVGLTRSNICRNAFQTRRTLYSGLSAKILQRARPQIPFFSGTFVNARPGLLNKGSFSSGYLQRFLSTSRVTMRHHVQPRRGRPRFLGFLGNIPQNTIFYGIIGLNAGVFTMWYMAGQVYVSSIPLPP